MKTIKQKFIIDESGSMSSQKATIINGFNEQIETMREEEKKSGGKLRYLVTLVKFNEKVTTLFTDKPLSEIDLLTDESYNPSGWTALYDAIGQTIQTAKRGETDNLITVMTDGFENRSREWKKNTVNTLIKLRQDENKWGFVFFGANQDAWAEASSLGIANAVNYTMANTGRAMNAMSMVRSVYTSSALDGTYNTSNLTCNVNQDDLVK